MLRKKIRSNRDGMKPSAIVQKSSAIAAHFISTLYPLLPAGGGIMVYLSTQSEARTDKIIGFFHEQGRVLYAPCIKSSKVCPVMLKRSCIMKKGAFGIPEPAAIKPLKSYKSIIAVLVPGIAFDMKGNRLGFGGGYFDRFLKKLPGRALKIALAFSGQIVKTVPKEPHDVKMDYIITENGVFKT